MTQSMADRDGVIWQDGVLKPWREATPHVLTHTLHYGVGCFEGIRAYVSAEGVTSVFRLPEHTRRLVQSARILEMPLPYGEAEISQAIVDVVRENKLAECYIRPMIFYGAEGMGLRATNLKAHMIVAAWGWNNYLGEAAAQGLRVRTSSYTRHHVNATLCRAKANANYLNSMLALNEVLRDGYDEALMLDLQGHVAEGSTENLFLVRDGVLSTPDLNSCLDGITRRTIMELAAEAGYPVRERRLTRDEVYIADEAFFTGTAAEVTPIREVDGRPIGGGARGPVTTALQRAYLAAVKGASAAHRGWLTPVA